MTVPLKKWGNSLALRIPKDIATTLSIEYDSLIDLDIVDNTLVLRPQKKRLLDSLVSQIYSEYIHKEISINGSMVNEEW